MCGICGFNWDDKKLVKEMANSIQHRGPDDSGCYTDKNVSLGHRRLAILDLSKKGRQPMSNENGNIWIVYNGEIYNFKELQKDLIDKGYRFKSDTDTEVVIYAYQEYGIDCLKKFNGMFAFCIYDMDKQILFLARDRMGIKPLYYFWDGQKFIFGSEIKAILRHTIKRELNQTALNKFLAFRYNSDKSTLFNDINKLMPSHYAIFNLKSKRLTEYPFWNIKINIMNRNSSYFSKKVKKIFADSVKKRLISDVPIGVYLSGGLDSSSIVAMIDKFNKNIKTFAVNFGNDQRQKDAIYAQKIANYFNTDHKTIYADSSNMDILPEIIWHLDEPIADPAIIPTYLLSKKVKQYATVIMNGAGGDELFGGYVHYNFLKNKTLFTLTPKVIKNDLALFLYKIMPKKILSKQIPYLSSFGNEGFKKFLEFINSSNSPTDFYLKIISIMTEKERRLLLKNNNNLSIYSEYKKWFDNKNKYMDNVLRLECRHFLVDDVLLSQDKVTMANSIEGRFPFLDHRLVETAFNIPFKYKLKGMNEKYILKQAMKKDLPKYVLARKKQGFFVPIDSWIEQEMTELKDRYLNEKNIKRQKIFNPHFIQKISKDFKNSKLYRARQLWNLINFEIWYEEFIENEKKI